MYESEFPSAPIIEDQEKVLIITRRIYYGDVRRHFVGIVERFDGRAMRVRGYAFVYNVTKGVFEKRSAPRERLFLADNHVIVFLLPEETELSAIRYEASKENGLLVTDGKHLKLELDEFND